MRKVAILVIGLLSSSCAAEIATTEPAAKEVPPNYRAQIVRQMSQAFDLGRIHDAGITPLVVTFVSLVHGTREVVCVATLQGALYQVTIFTFKDGQAELLSTSIVRGSGSVSRIKLNVSGYCRGLTTSPLPEIVRGKPS